MNSKNPMNIKSMQNDNVKLVDYATSRCLKMIQTVFQVLKMFL